MKQMFTYADIIGGLFKHVLNNVACYAVKSNFKENILRKFYTDGIVSFIQGTTTVGTFTEHANSFTMCQKCRISGRYSVCGHNQ